MDEHDILSQIRSLVEREHQLRSQGQDGEIAPDEEQAQLRQLEESLDQCWDLLRQRRAKADAGEDPADADARPISQVEGYRQ